MNATEQSTRRERWQAIIEEQEKSGVSQSEYCKQNNLTLSQFTYYRGIVRAPQRPTTSTLNAFKPIKINNTDQPVSSNIRILLPNGFQCYIPSHVDALQVKRLVEVLLSC